ncbi:hypothetical protein [Pseudomonas syringae]|nr:hypothetical protein [Pseudomonas syringae]AKT31174.1 membrane protein [Pseudomonas syringae pv. actinidiae ICMP 18884]AOE57569.1 hypothetical protein NZ708_16930 [Pseudomonas syringae pv. actinidiae ICMP 18708]APP98525.1 hypothetical protein PsaNZ45_17480 [Pseudomonas syringae pv. actinidiae]APQ04282.1 hypothetical protein PsaNZ47_16925 [Pseudomonas syringae pv. actinidiae]AQX59916.1 hypothetical protein B1R35_18705 [Pseudomonas syringae pv. actinidiae]
MRLNLPESGLPATPDQCPELQQLIRGLLAQALKYKKRIIAMGSLFGAIAPVCTLFAYLIVIGRIDLFLPSITMGPALLTWLASTILLFLLAIVSIATPAVLFAALVSIFGLPARDSAKLAARLALLVAGGFSFLLVASYVVSLKHFFWSIPLVWLLGFIGMMVIVAGSESRRDKYLIKIEGAKWYRTRVSLFTGFVTLIYSLTVLMGISPTLFIAWSHPYESSQVEKFIVIAAPIIWMLLICLPVISYYNTDGTMAKSASNAASAAVIAILGFFLVSPFMFGLVAYASASTVGLRSQEVSEYIVSKKYPRATVDTKLWEVKDIDDPDKTFTIKAFPLFRLGETLLLCPAKYSHTDRAHIAEISKLCFDTKTSEMTRAAPSQASSTFFLKETYCGRAVTRLPYVLITKKRCIFAPPSSSSLRH